MNNARLITLVHNHIATKNIRNIIDLQNLWDLHWTLSQFNVYVTPRMYCT